MNAKVASTVLGAALVGAIAWSIGRTAAPLQPYALWLALAGVLVGAAVTPLAFRAWIARAETYIANAPAEDLIVSVVGLGVGLLIGALLAVPLVMLSAPVGNLLPIVVALVSGFVFMRMAQLRRLDLQSVLARRPVAAVPDADQNGHRPKVLLDTSAIIDGRIADISATGFITSDIVIPRFVLDELRHIADSPDVLRRTRGRRGLDMLNRMSKDAVAPVQVMDIDPREVRDAHEVDSKLVQVARKLHAPIITTDWNLNKVAQLQGVRVMNVNELANAVKPVVLPNEEMEIKIIQVGKEPGQGIGYLDDGTMIVVEDGSRHIDQEVDIVVTRVLQTVAGRMIFAALKGQPPRPSSYNGGRSR